MDIGAYALLRPAAICEATWARAAVADPWAEAGGNGIGTDRRAVPESAVSLAGIRTWYAWDLTTLVREWVGGELPNHGVMLRATNMRAYSYRLASAQDAIMEVRPRLVIIYEEGTGSER